MTAETELDKRLLDQASRVETIQRWLREETLSRQIGPRSQESWERLVRQCEAEFWSEAQPPVTLVSDESKGKDARWLRRVLRRIRS